jgi:hypothetical protein
VLDGALVRVAFATRRPDTKSPGSRFRPMRNACSSARHTELAHLLEVGDLCRANSEPYKIGDQVGRDLGMALTLRHARWL